MSEVDIPREALKQAMKEALAETLTEKQELFREMFTEVLEDFALVGAIEEGRQTKKVNRERIFDLLEDRP